MSKPKIVVPPGTGRDDRREWLCSIGSYNYVGADKVLEERAQLLFRRDVQQRRLGMALAATFVRRLIKTLAKNGHTCAASSAKGTLKELETYAGALAIRTMRRKVK